MHQLQGELQGQQVIFRLAKQPEMHEEQQPVPTSTPVRQVRHQVQEEQVSQGYWQVEHIDPDSQVIAGHRERQEELTRYRKYPELHVIQYELLPIHVEHQGAHNKQEYECWQYPDGHYMRHLLGGQKIYPERQVVQLEAVTQQVRQGYRQGQHTRPLVQQPLTWQIDVLLMQVLWKRQQLGAHEVQKVEEQHIRHQTGHGWHTDKLGYVPKEHCLQVKVCWFRQPIWQERHWVEVRQVLQGKEHILQLKLLISPQQLKEVDIEEQLVMQLLPNKKKPLMQYVQLSIDPLHEKQGDLHDTHCSVQFTSRASCEVGQLVTQPSFNKIKGDTQERQANLERQVRHGAWHSIHYWLWGQQS